MEKRRGSGEHSESRTGGGELRVGMKRERLRGILEQSASRRVAVIGDVCLDLYLFLSDLSEASLETGLATHVVEHACTYLGGAGNVAVNCVALGAGEVALFGVIGDDMYGRQIVHLCGTESIQSAGLLVQREEWHTNVYTKPYRGAKEQSRFDFGTLNRLREDTSRRMLAKLRAELPEYDAVIVNQQITNGLHSRGFRTGLSKLIRSLGGTPVFLDSRDFPDDFAGTIRKLNLREARRTPEAERLHSLGGRDATTLVERLARRWEAPVYLTRGEAGCIVATQTETSELPAVAVDGPVDTVGAGDAMLAASALAHAAGAGHREAGEVGILAAGVTVRKLYRTGVASAEEVLQLAEEAEYIYKPDLASSPFLANYHDGTNIELVDRLPPAGGHGPGGGAQPVFAHTENGTRGSAKSYPAASKHAIPGGARDSGAPPFRYAIFDHDGTVSTVREGWERIMEPVMCEAVLGGRLEEASGKTLDEVRGRVHELIDRTTGLQTIVQMQKLVSLVEEFDWVPKSQIKSPEEYKAIYNRRLLEKVHEQLERLRRGELAVCDVTIKNAVAMLRRLRESGLRLYLASGTDDQDVRAEAEVLGYAELFDGGIVGSVGDATHDPKSLVLRRILDEIGAENARQMITFGDGPVEIRETKKACGYAVGVASDEVRRYGIDLNKRRRLVRAGADIVVPDFSQMSSLLRFLGFNEPTSEGEAVRA